MSEICDLVSEAVVPFLIHFSERGIVPKILSVEGGFCLNLRAAEGPRLGTWLKTASADEMRKVYGVLGSHIGYISKYGVAHEDLHTFNVVVENGFPVIIDWGKASAFFCKHDMDAGVLLDDTEKQVRAEYFPNLKKVFSDAFQKELSLPPDVSTEEIVMKSWRLYGA